MTAPRRDIGFILHYPLNAAIKGDDVDWALIPVDLTVGRDLADRLTFLRNANGADAFGDAVEPPIAVPAASPAVEREPEGDGGTQSAAPSEDDAIDAAVAAVTAAQTERRHYRDLATTPTQADDLAHLNAHPDEGGDVDTATVAAIGERYMALSPERRSWVTAVGANVRLNPAAGGVASERRREVLTALIDLADDFDQDDIVRGICHRTLGDVAHFANVAPAELVGALGIDEARKFAAAAKALIAGNASVRWDEQRRCFVEPSRAA